MKAQDNQELLFEKFEIRSCLKKDEISAVYLAWHIYLEKDIFLKVLNTKNLPDPSLLIRFKREAKILAHLKHPNIIQVYDFGTYKEFFYISFEYFESQNLRFWLQNKSLNQQQKFQLLKQLFSAVAFAHEQGIIHRDLKPENILIDEHLNLKIADFGLALVKDDSRITEAQSVVGTPAYMSPEQIQGEKLTIQTDQFNLGIIILELFTGHNPFLGKDAGQTINNILNFSEDNLKQQIKKLPVELQRLTLRLLQKKPQQRFSSSKKLLDFFQDEHVEVEANEKHTRWLIYLAFLLGLILTIGLLFQLKNRPDVQVGLKETDLPLSHGLDSASIKSESTKPPHPVKSPGKKSFLKTKSNFTLRPEQKVNSEKESVSSKKATKGVTTIHSAQLWLECFPWAEVEVDSQFTFTTPMSQPLTLASGPHVLRLRHPNFPVYQATVLLKPGEKKKVKLKLDTLFSYLNCQIHPWGKIYIDGELVDQTPLKKPVAVLPGKRILTILNDRFPAYHDTLIFKRNDTLLIKVNLLQTAVR